MEIAVPTKQVRLRTPSCPKLFQLSSIFYENSRSIYVNSRSTQQTPLADPFTKIAVQLLIIIRSLLILLVLISFAVSVPQPRPPADQFPLIHV